MITCRNLSVLSCAFAMLVVAQLAHANTVSGAVYINGTTGAIPGTLPPGAPSATFLLGSPGDIFNMTGNPLPLPSTYTINGFLTSGGDVATYFTGGGLSGSDLDNTLFVFSGFVDLAPGKYTVTHDDGVIVTVGGVTYLNAPNPTSAKSATFKITTDTGFVPFQIEYAEVYGPPAVLDVSGGSARFNSVNPNTPEPSSFVLLGSGLLAAAGMIRRRVMA